MTQTGMKHKKLWIVLSVILAFVLVFVSTFFIMLKVGRNKLKKSLTANESVMADTLGEAEIYRDGKGYNYNKDLVNILLIGVDKDNLDVGKKEGQADALYLISADVETGKVNVFCISRNTMADMDILDVDGNPYGTERAQICLSYAYGRDDVQSSENAAKSVSGLFSGIPINGYYTIRMDNIGDIVDTVGGVKVTLTEDILPKFKNNKVGDTVTLNGSNTLSYLRFRGDSNVPRLARHKIFISAFVSAAKSAVSHDLTLPLKVYKQLSSDAVTNISASSAVYLATRAAKASFHMISIPGQSGTDGKYETFEADKDALYDMVVDNFYKLA